MAASKLQHREKERYWLGVARRWQASGLSQMKFCQQEGIDERQFYSWRSRLEKKQVLAILPANKELAVETVPDAQKQAQFIPVEIKPAASEVVVQERVTGRLEIVTPGGYVVRIP